MALVIEDGTGRPDADSYLSAADALARLSNLGLVKFSGLSAPVQESALRLATQRLDSSFNVNSRGVPNNDKQALAFPRYLRLRSGRETTCTEVPEEVKHATALLAEWAAYNDFDDDLAEDVVGASEVTLADGVKVKQGAGASMTRRESNVARLSQKAVAAVVFQEVLW